MKKIALILAVLICIASFAGCSNSGAATVPERGTVDSGKYTSTTLGISFSASEDWAFMGDEDMADYYGEVSEEFNSEGADIIYDMLAYSLGGASVNVNYENMGKLYGKVIDESSYLEISKEKISEAFADAGYSVSYGDLSKESLGGKDFDCLDITIDAGGVDVYEKIMVKKIGDYMGIVTVATPSEADFSTVLSCFA